MARTPDDVYALSNAGSLLALLAYPLIVEPAVGLATHATHVPQCSSWASARCVVPVLARPRDATRVRSRHARSPQSGRRPPVLVSSGARSCRQRRSRFSGVRRCILLAAVPLGHCSQRSTNFITTDLISGAAAWVGAARDLPALVHRGLLSRAADGSCEPGRCSRADRDHAAAGSRRARPGAWPAIALVALRAGCLRRGGPRACTVAGGRSPARIRPDPVLPLDLDRRRARQRLRRRSCAPIAFKGIWELTDPACPRAVRARDHGAAGAWRRTAAARTRRVATSELRVAFTSTHGRRAPAPRCSTRWSPGSSSCALWALASPAVAVVTNWLLVGGMLLVVRGSSGRSTPP